MELKNISPEIRNSMDGKQMKKLRDEEIWSWEHRLGRGEGTNAAAAEARESAWAAVEPGLRAPRAAEGGLTHGKLQARHRELLKARQWENSNTQSGSGEAP